MSMNAAQQCRCDNQVAGNLSALLAAWKLSNLLPLLEAQYVDAEVLLLMKPRHVSALLRGHPLGIQVLFEHKLAQWRFQHGRPLYDDNSAACNIRIAAPTVDNGDTTETAFVGEVTPNGTLRATTFTTLSTTESSVATIGKDCMSLRANDEDDETEFEVENDSKPISSSLERAKMPYAAISPLAANRTNVVQQKLATYRGITVRKILDQWPRGEKLLHCASEGQDLTNFQRIELIAIISDYFYKHNLALPQKVCKRLEREVHALFPNENMRHYYSPCGKSRIKQRLLNTRYYRAMRREELASKGMGKKSSESRRKDETKRGLCHSQAQDDPLNSEIHTNVTAEDEEMLAVFKTEVNQTDIIITD